MIYDFSSRERELGRVVFALALDGQKMTERVIIGRAEQARARFELAKPVGRNARQIRAGQQLLPVADSDGIYYDETRPIGSLLFSFEGGKTSEWNGKGLILRESYSKIFPFDSKRWEMAAPVADWLKTKYDGGEPSAMFAAVKTWENYLNCFNLNHSADLLMERLAALYRPFAIYSENRFRPRQDSPEWALREGFRENETNVELWYIMAKRPFECAVTSSSFLPIISYCLHKIEEWGYVYQICNACEKEFFAKSGHIEICSDECRKKQSVAAKREFDERAKVDRVEQLDEAAYYYWYNRLRRLRGKKATVANPERVAAFKAEFDKFRKEAVKRKASVKKGKRPLAEFTKWLAEQQNAADTLMAADAPELDSAARVLGGDTTLRPKMG